MKKAIFLFMISLLAVYALQAQIDSIRFPVSLSSFEAGLSNNTTKLKWKTECYLTYANFQIQKSSNAVTFTTLNSFIADRLRCQQPFEFIDSADYNSNIVYYRINAGDIDGHFYHSKIIKVSQKQTNFELISVHPTVIKSKTTLIFSSPYDGNIKINLTNPLGILVKQYNYQVNKGVQNFILDLSAISKGNYWITSVDSKGKQRTVAIIRQ